MGDYDALINTFVEISIKEPDDFLKIKETLSRIGITSLSNKTLYQSCHILHKRGRLFIVHFKELFMLDGREVDFSESDRARRNTIANLLDQWGLLQIKNKRFTEEPTMPIYKINIISHKDKHKWNLEQKYTIGKKQTC